MLSNISYLMSNIYRLMSNIYFLLSKYSCILLMSLFFTPSFSQTSFPNYKILLVKLKTNQSQINILKDRGYYDKALNIECKLKADAMAIQEAFGKFTRVPVYFFRSHDTDSLLYGKNKQLILFNAKDSVLTDSVHYSQILNNEYIIGEFGVLEASDLSFSAFILSDFRNKPFKRPLKYYIKSRYIFIKKSYQKIVLELNTLLAF